MHYPSPWLQGYWDRYCRYLTHLPLSFQTTSLDSKSGQWWQVRKLSHDAESRCRVERMSQEEESRCWVERMSQDEESRCRVESQDDTLRDNSDTTRLWEVPECKVPRGLSISCCLCMYNAASDSLMVRTIIPFSVTMWLVCFCFLHILLVTFGVTVICEGSGWIHCFRSDRVAIGFI